MKYPRILSAIRSAKWAVTPRTLQAISDVLGAHMRGVIAPRADFMPVIPGPPASPTPAEGDPSEAIAIIPVHGIIGKNLSSLEMMCGGCDVDAVQGAIDEAIADPDVDAILLAIDSPGGVVTGVPELTAAIRAAGAEKPIYAFTDAQCCSAAYWIASACKAIFCTMTADVGSIGVYVALIDDSEWWQKEGYKLELIKAGEFKAMGISGQPLAAAERDLIQADVNTIYGMFTGDVVKGRGAIEPAVMQGQTFMGEAAVTAGLADAIVTCLDDALDEIVEDLEP
jgi:signal peptide peptidase SppA